MTAVAAFTYPWDVLGDPAAPARLRELGADTAVLAAAYHSATAVTPRHPLHRVVHAPHSAVYYPPDPARWGSAALRPAPQRWCGTADAYGQAARQLRDAGLDVHAWVVLTHNSRLGAAHPEHAVRNAYGDSLSWALCIAQPPVRAYAATLAAEAAVQPGTSGVELESCGCYGYAHAHAHDKTGGVPFGEAARYLLSLCFCPACHDGYASHGADPGQLRVAVRDALEPLWRGNGGGGDGWASVQDLLGAELASATLLQRLAATRSLQQEVIAAVRAEAGQGCRIMLHADPVPYRTGANPGVMADDVLGGDILGGDLPARADGLVIPAAAVSRMAAACPPAGRPPAPALAANHQIISGMGGGGDFTVPPEATEIRLYHPGLASDLDLRAAAVSVARYLATRMFPCPAGEFNTELWRPDGPRVLTNAWATGVSRHRSGQSCSSFLVHSMAGPRG